MSLTKVLGVDVDIWAVCIASLVFLGTLIGWVFTANIPNQEPSHNNPSTYRITQHLPSGDSKTWEVVSFNRGSYTHTLKFETLEGETIMITGSYTVEPVSEVTNNE